MMNAPRRCLPALTAGLVLVSSSLSAALPTLNTRTFRLTYRATLRAIPEGACTLEAWVPMPQTDANQTIHQVSIAAPGPVTIAREPREGNQSLNVRIEHPGEEVAITLTITATRRENSGRAGPPTSAERAADLSAEPLVPTDGVVRDLAVEATRGMKTDEEKARAIYDKVTGMMKYDKSGSGWGRGDALFACNAKRGNCTDFHALIIGMARSVGIPARFAIGLPSPEARGSGEIPSYHCWAELYIEGRGWVPIDSSEAAKDPSKRDYFFGHHDENRLEFSRGRHLKLAPSQHGPPLNFFVYPYAEIDGKPHAAIDHTFSFEDLPAGTGDR
jgi:transglutaminase-like putative cysteine protease